jgi:Fe2+ transport system protein B
VAVLHQEARSWRWTLFDVLLLLLIALSAGAVVYKSAQWLGIGA